MLEITTLFITEPDVTRNVVEMIATPENDAASLGALLYETHVLTPGTMICAALDWPLERVRTALDDLEALLRAHLLSNGISLAEARVLYQIMRGMLRRNLGNADTVALGTLINAGLVQLNEAKSKNSAPSWVLADDVRYSLLLDP